MKKALLSLVLVLIASAAFGATEIRQTGMYVSSGLGVSGDHRLGNTCVASTGGRTYCGLNASHLSFFADNGVSLELLYGLALASDNGVSAYCLKSAGDNTFYWGVCSTGVTSLPWDNITGTDNAITPGKLRATGTPDNTMVPYWDNSGQFRWATPSSGTVTEVTGDSMIAVATGTSTPALSINDNSVTNAKFKFSGGTTANEGNAFYGWGAGGSAISGADQNVGIGSVALYNLTSGDGNVAVGRGALYSNTSGTLNVALGLDAARGNTTGTQNIAIGQDALYTNSVSSSNIAIGNRALVAAVGDNNVALGDNAGANMSGGSGNVFLGHNAGENEAGSNKLYIANSNTGSPLILGDFSAQTIIINGFFEASINLDAANIGDGSVDNATLARLAGVTSNIQTQLDAKGTGDVSGPASSTDLAVAKYDGTGGKTLLNSGCTISADNVMTCAGFATNVGDGFHYGDFTNSGELDASAQAAGRIAFDNTAQCFKSRNNDNTVTFSVGCLLNSTSFTIPDTALTDNTIFWGPLDRARTLDNIIIIIQDNTGKRSGAATDNATFNVQYGADESFSSPTNVYTSNVTATGSAVYAEALNNTDIPSGGYARLVFSEVNMTNKKFYIRIRWRE